MKKINFKGFRAHSNKKDTNKTWDEIQPLDSQSGSENSDFGNTCSLADAVCPTCFLNLRSSTQNQKRRSPNVGIFYTLRKKFTSHKPCSREDFDGSCCRCCFNSSRRHNCKSSEETICHKKHCYRSRSAERFRSHRSEQDQLASSKPGPKSVQLHKRQIHAPLSENTMRCKETQLKKYDSDSDDEHVECPAVCPEHRCKAANTEKKLRDINKPFDGYGHASSPKCNDDRAPSLVASHDSANNDFGVAPATLNRDPTSLRHYDQVKEPVREPWSLTRELLKLSSQGWYWGPINRIEAEEKLDNQPDGAFLVRDSSDERHLLSLSFRSYGRTLHTRIEHCNGVFSFYAQPESEGYCSIVELIDNSMNNLQSGVFYYSRARTPGSPSFPVQLSKPISRFTQVRTLQYLCRFVIRQRTRVDHIQSLPLPASIRGWLQQKQY